MDEEGEVECWTYQGGTFTSADSWMQGGSGTGGNIILEWDTDTSTTRNQIKGKQRKQGIQVSYKHPDYGVIIEQYVGTGVSDGDFGADTNWRKVFSENQLGSITQTDNLFNPDNVIFGKYINTEGAETDLANSYCSGYIPVEPDTIYAININVSVNINCNTLSYYTDSKTYISGITRKSFVRFKTPSNCYFIRFTFTHNYIHVINRTDLVLMKGVFAFKHCSYFTYKSDDIRYMFYNMEETKNLLDLSRYIFSDGNQNAIYVPSNGKPISIIDYNTENVSGRDSGGVSNSVIKYYSVGADGDVEVSDPVDSDVAGIGVSLYGIGEEQYIKYLSKVVIFNIEDGVFPILPIVPHFSSIGSDNLVSKSIVEYAYGNINPDVAMNGVVKDKFVDIYDYSNEDISKFLKKEDGIYKIVFEAGQGIVTNSSIPYERRFLIDFGTFEVSNCMPIKAYNLPFNFSMIIETDMPLMELLKDRFAVFYRFLYDETLATKSLTYSNEVHNMDGSVAESLEVGEKYILYTFDNSKYHECHQVVTILSETSFKIQAQDSIELYNVNTENIKGKPLSFRFQAGVYLYNNNWEEQKKYYYKAHSPKFNMYSLAIGVESLTNLYGTLFIALNENKLIPSYIDTDISSVKQDSQQNFTSLIEGDFVTKNELKGANVVWLGTSVPNEPPFGEGKTKKYPEFVASLLNINLTVRAIGGTKMTYNPDENVYGLSMTKAEYESYQSAAGVERSYETQLEGCWDSDLFVFDHLHNDNGLLAALKDNPDYWDSDLQTFKITETNKFDRKWAVGAFNYVIAEIFRYNPRAKIAIINDWRAEPYYNKLANRVVADMWGIPICELRMCNGNVDITTTKDTYLKRYNGGANIKLLVGSSANPLYFQSKSAPDESSAVAEEETSITYKKGSDSIHPGRYGRIMYAKHVAMWMKNNVLLDRDLSAFIQ